MVSGQDIFAGISGSNDVPEIAMGTRRNKELMYWRKCAGCTKHTQENNWITTGPAMSPYTAVEYTEFQQLKHMTPLNKYGTYIIGSVPGQKYNLSKPEERFRAIIELGGIDEFPTDQMVAYNWHKFPVVCAARPELNDIVDIKCQHGCSNRTFVRNEDYLNHISIMHKEVAQPEAIGKALEKAIGNRSNLDPSMIAQIVVAVREAMSFTPNIEQNIPSATLSEDELSELEE